MTPISDKQQVFETCYQGRNSVFHHAAYMRLCKVFFVLHTLRSIHCNVSQKSLFDYAFGAGTLFQHLPKSTKISGVELDASTVRIARETLFRKGYPNVDLDIITLKDWASHRLLKMTHDIIICSHILEHVPNPPDFLRTLLKCLAPNGIIVCLVPINELGHNPAHEHEVSKSRIELWVKQSGARLLSYNEDEPYSYYLQPIWMHKSGLIGVLGRALSLVIGTLALALGPRLWFLLSPYFQAITKAKPAQCAFVLTH